MAEVRLGHKEEVPVTHLRKKMLEELQRRNYSEGTTRAYLHAVRAVRRTLRKITRQVGAG